MMPGKHAEHAGFGAAGRGPRRRRLRKQTAVARSAQMRREDAGLSFEAKNRAVDVRFAREDTNVVRQISCRKIIRAVDDDIVWRDRSPVAFSLVKRQSCETTSTFGLIVAESARWPLPVLAGRHRSFRKESGAADSRYRPDRNRPVRSCRLPQRRDKAQPASRVRPRRCTRHARP